MAQVGVIWLAPQNYIVQREAAALVTDAINWIDSDWQEHLGNVQTDPDHKPFHPDSHRDYVEGIRAKWTSFLSTPMFEIRLEGTGAQRSGVQRTVARVMDRVQANEWMPPLNTVDKEVHQKARLSLRTREEEELSIADDCLLFGECDPLPVEE